MFRAFYRRLARLTLPLSSDVIRGEGEGILPSPVSGKWPETTAPRGLMPDGFASLCSHKETLFCSQKRWLPVKFYRFIVVCPYCRSGETSTFLPGAATSMATSTVRCICEALEVLADRHFNPNLHRYHI